MKVCREREVNGGGLNSVMYWTVSGSCSICSFCQGESNLQGSVSLDETSLVGTSDEGSSS